MESNPQYLSYLFPTFSKMFGLPLISKLGVVSNLNNNNNIGTSTSSFVAFKYTFAFAWCLLRFFTFKQTMTCTYNVRKKSVTFYVCARHQPSLLVYYRTSARTCNYRPCYAPYKFLKSKYYLQLFAWSTDVKKKYVKFHSSFTTLTKTDQIILHY